MSKFKYASLQSELYELAISNDLTFETKDTQGNAIFEMSTYEIDIKVIIDYARDTAIVEYSDDVRTDSKICDSNEHILEKVQYFM